MASEHRVYFLLWCPDLPWAAQVIQKKVAQGHAGYSLSLIPIINCLLMSGNDSGKWACQIFAYSPYKPFSGGHWTHTLCCRWNMRNTEPNLNVARLSRASGIMKAFLMQHYEDFFWYNLYSIFESVVAKCFEVGCSFLNEYLLALRARVVLMTRQIMPLPSWTF